MLLDELLVNLNNKDKLKFSCLLVFICQTNININGQRAVSTFDAPEGSRGAPSYKKPFIVVLD